jgi:outer membrane protein assembly factor BamB
MKKTLTLLAIFAASSFAAEITGFIGDSMCGAKHKAGTAADAKCATSCMTRGDKAVLVTSEGKVYTIDAAGQKKVASFVGKTATITGDVSGDSITIASIK